MRVKRSKKTEWRTSFASMSDIAFLLIIFFALAGKFTKSSEKDVMLPSADMGERSRPREITVIVTKNGEYLVNGVKKDPEELQQEVSFYIVPEAPKENKTVTVFADRDADYGAVAKAIDAVNQADGYLELAVREQR